MNKVYDFLKKAETYYLATDGVIIYASDKVKAAENPAQMLELLMSN